MKFINTKWKLSKQILVFGGITLGLSIGISLPIILSKSSKQSKQSKRRDILLNPKNFNSEIKLLYNRNLKLLNLGNIDSSQIWDDDFSNYNFEGVLNLNSKNTPFQGDISGKTLHFTKLKDVDVSKVTKWPNNLIGINWKGVKFGPNGEGNPFKGDMSQFNMIDQISSDPEENLLENSFYNPSRTQLFGIDVSKVTKWPKGIHNNVDWSGIIGLTSANTPFKGDLTITQKIISGNAFNDLDLSAVSKWPKNIPLNDWTGAKFGGDTNQGNPFVGDLKNYQIYGSILKTVDLSKITDFPINLFPDNFKYEKIPMDYSGAILKGDLSNFPIKVLEEIAKTETIISKPLIITDYGSHLSSKPAILNLINEIKSKKPRINKHLRNKVLIGDISTFDLTDEKLSGFDVSKVTKWPKNLKGIDWTGIEFGPNGEGSPFVGDISEYKISHDDVFIVNFKFTRRVDYLPPQATKFFGVNFSKVTKWPDNLTSINWTGAKFGPNGEGNPFNGRFKITSVINPSNIEKERVFYNSTFKGMDLSKVVWDFSLENWSPTLFIQEANFIGAKFGPNDEGSPFDKSKWPVEKGIVIRMVKIDLDDFKNRDKIIQSIGKDYLDKNRRSAVHYGHRSNIKFLKSSGQYIKLSELPKISGYDVLFYTLVNYNYSFDKIDFENNQVVNNKLLEFRHPSFAGSKNLIFKGDISNAKWGSWGIRDGYYHYDNNKLHEIIPPTILKDANFAEVTKWHDLWDEIDFSGAIFGPNGEGNPFKGDLSGVKLRQIKIKGIDVSKVTKWPFDLKGVDFSNAIFGPNGEGNPFKGDISKYEIRDEKYTYEPLNKAYPDRRVSISDGVKLNGVDVSKVTKWPTNLKKVDFTGAIFGPNGEGNPFKGDISTYELEGTKLFGVDVSKVTKWPTYKGIDFSGVNFGVNNEHNLFKGDISTHNLEGIKLNGVDVSKVTKWPTNLKKVDFTGAIFGQNDEGNPFIGNGFRKELDFSFSKLPKMDFFKLISKRKNFNFTNIDITNIIKNDFRFKTREAWVQQFFKKSVRYYTYFTKVYFKDDNNKKIYVKRLV